VLNLFFKEKLVVRSNFYCNSKYFNCNVSGSAATPFKGHMQKIAEMASKELKKPCTVDNVTMDGNCLSSSLALQLGRSSPTAGRTLRGEIVDYIKSNPQMVEVFICD